MLIHFSIYHCWIPRPWRIPIYDTRQPVALVALIVYTRQCSTSYLLNFSIFLHNVERVTAIPCGGRHRSGITHHQTRMEVSHDEMYELWRRQSSKFEILSSLWRFSNWNVSCTQNRTTSCSQ